MPRNILDENPQEIEAEEKRKGFRARLITDGVFIFSLVVAFLMYSF